MTSDGSSATAVAELAEVLGVQTNFGGADGRRHRADEDVLLAILNALGTSVTSQDQAKVVLHDYRRAALQLRLEPILVHRVGGTGAGGGAWSTTTQSTTLTLPDRVHPRDVWCTIECEDGEVRHQRLLSTITAMAAGPALDQEGVNRYHFQLEPNPDEPLAPGYHRVIMEWPGAKESALLVAAPACPAATPGWGAFLPLHALRTDQDWGVGSYPDLAKLGAWLGEIGSSMLGTLPLYPAFLDPPADPSPYLPVSRLAYNEVFVDPISLPEMDSAPEARRLLSSDEFRRRLLSVHDSSLVEYEEVSRLRREILTVLSDALLAGSSSRRDAFCAFVDQHPELLAYARFRAISDHTGHHSRNAIRAQMQKGHHSVREPEMNYHLYAQWVAAQQLSAAADATPLYADLPVGVHPDGFDPLWAPHAFAPGVHGGAPPDLFFGGGQDWAFPPLHPERIRQDEYRYVIATLRRAFRHADYLRVDHVMGLHRLYWIPEGFDARHGAYVSYRADELHALVSLEAHRSGTVVVGEDLGTVPDVVRASMAEDRMLRSWVLQFESTPVLPLPTAPAPVLASWGTHDLPRFGAYFRGEDIDEDEADGRLSAAEAIEERAQRERWRTALLRALGEDGAVGDVAAMALRACLAHLAQGAAHLMLVDLEELWGERGPQNRPGTGTEAGNWRRRASRTLEAMYHDRETIDFLGQINELRYPGVPALLQLEGVR
jgi:4-alpha-glucanotransferase